MDNDNTQMPRVQIQVSVDCQGERDQYGDQGALWSLKLLGKCFTLESN